ncbi:hypothetical protein [Sphingomonas baiyangensis]|uniref:Uncharacterized protein n=1 Tax=Sphingomonas baiyangensis TaxID=2572576 RepID=A0A4V5PTP8_9SPHN|nr:hypothetical protein [Sphingomonas baiyangensis]TKD50858.1 hypothetical protein FBR43_08825 [Sphingomonas baiyangensis]
MQGHRAFAGLTLALALTGAATAQTPPAPYPARAVLDAFRAACGELGSVESAAKRAAAAGWAPVSDRDATPLGRVIALGEASATQLLAKEGGRMAPTRLLTRTIDGEALHLLLTGVSLQGTRVVGCRLYDVGETRALPPGEMSAWLGREPIDTVMRGGMVQTVWEPGLSPAQETVELFFVRGTDAVTANTQVAGIALKADQMGKEQD